MGLTQPDGVDVEVGSVSTVLGVDNGLLPHDPDPGDVKLKAEFANGKLPDLDVALADLAPCDDFYCIKRAYYAIGGRTRFNMPHFFLIGWQKCATTSVNLHLRAHPEYLPSPVKESHYWTTCQHFWNHTSCMAHNYTHYIHEFFRLHDAVESRLEKVSVDASVDYAWKGAMLAPQLHQLFPWIKLVIIMREPLSRLISYVRMYTQRGHEVKGCLGDRPMFDCLQYHLGENIIFLYLSLLGMCQVCQVNSEERKLCMELNSCVLDKRKELKQMIYLNFA